MRKIDKKYFYWGLTALFVVCASICFYFLLVNGQDFSSAKDNVIHILMPIIDGLVLAYLLNPILNWFEKYVVNRMFKKSMLKNPTKSYEKKIRCISLIFTVIVFLIIVAGLILLIVPQLFDSIQKIITRFPFYISSLTTWTNGVIKEHKELQDFYNAYWENITDYATKEFLPKLQSVMQSVSSTILGSVWGVLVFVFNFLIGLILSVYLLYQKEIYIAQSKKVIYSMLSEERANTLINNLRYANKAFGGFLAGKLVDSLIIGLICFILTTLFQIPYALLVSVIVGVTNIIPFFGPYIGGIVCGFLVLMVDPVKTLVFVIMVLVLQQFDGNILGPKILGDSTGLNSFWIIFAITVFSGIFGALGMFIGVPVFAVIYAAFKTFINTRLEKKELPVETSFYVSADYHSQGPVVDNHGDEIRFVKKTFENVGSEKLAQNEEVLGNENNKKIR